MLNDWLEFLTGNLGFRVFPVRNKRPALAGWQDKATDDPEEAIAMFKFFPAAQVGARTGVKGLFALDFDTVPTDDVLSVLPETLTTKTAQGLHLFYRSSEPIRNRVGWKPNLDVRGVGGFVVVPPSLHPSGIRYAFLDPSRAVSEAPAALVEALKAGGERKRLIPQTSYGGIDHDIIVKAFDVTASRVANAQEGTRNATLFSAACEVAEWVRAGLIHEDYLAKLVEISSLPEDEAIRTVMSAYQAK